jgi:hypothetical protein
VQVAVDSCLEHGTQRVGRADFVHLLQRESDVFASVSDERATIFIRWPYANHPLRFGWIQETLRDETTVFISYIVVDRP